MTLPMIRLLLLLLILFIATPAFAAGGIVSAADPRAAEAGREMLRAGGSATDAALAMLLALTVVEPQSSGIGGGGFLLHHDAATGAIATIDGRETAPASAGANRFLDADGQRLPFAQAWPGGFSVGVPGNVRLMASAHQRWGKLPWARLFSPAIRLAEEGFVVSPRLNGAIADTARTTGWQDFPEISAIYFPGGRPAEAGKRLANPALAALLRRIAAEGPDAFYAGVQGKAITDAVANTSRNPTTLTLADLAAYRARDRYAVCGRYRAYRVCGMGPPSSGGIAVLQILGLLERFDLARPGPDSPVAWHLLAEAMQLAYADRDKYVADPDFVAVPVAGLIDRAYLRGRSRLISLGRSLPSYQAGAPPGAPPRTAAVSGEVAGTTHFVAVDGRGEVVSMTSTVESAFGSQLVAGGAVLNNELTDFSFAPEENGAPVANRVAPGKRPRSSMAPTIVYDAKGRVVLALGSAGGPRIIMHVAKTLIGVLDWKLPAEQAIALPNIFFGGGAVLVEKGSALEAMAPALARFGQTVTPATLGSKVNAVERVGEGWRGAADPRGDGVALAE